MTQPSESTGRPSGISIAKLTLASLAAALLILFAAVLPAEYNRDPTGLGKLTGISKLWAQDEQVVAAQSSAGAPSSTSFPQAFRSDVVEIPLQSSEDLSNVYEVEYKVHLKKGTSLVYSWEAPGVDPEAFYSEFHGHTVEEGKTMTVAFYRKEMGSSDNGVLTAPFDGVHGWYFQNQSEKPVVIKLRLAGFYDLVPPGNAGNEAGLIAKRVE